MPRSFTLVAALCFSLLSSPLFALDDSALNTSATALPDEPEPTQSALSDPIPSETDNTKQAASNTPVPPRPDAKNKAASKSAKPEKKAYRIYDGHHDMSAVIHTKYGNLCCNLFLDDHPFTVLNFNSLATGKKPWTDKSGQKHSTPYYTNLAFGTREANNFVASQVRSEGTNFVIKDERCNQHFPVAGSIAMVQPHPGAASTQFVLLARDLPQFSGMYTVFGQCQDVDLIKKLTSHDATIDNITISDGQACQQ